MGVGFGSKTNATQEPQILGVQVTTSLYNSAIPLLVGKRRAAGRVIWYGAFGPSGGSGKKGKSGKKGGPTSYQANLDMLIAFGPIWSIQSVWQNSSIVGYGSGLSSFSRAGHQDFSITAANSYSGTVTNQPAGYNLDFISAISFIPSTPTSASIDDYGDPQGSRTITETVLRFVLHLVLNSAQSGRSYKALKQIREARLHGVVGNESELPVLRIEFNI
jgi:hypothetical protein